MSTTEATTIKTFELSPIPEGVSGGVALQTLNAHIAATEAALNTLALEVNNLNSKSAVIRKQVPISNKCVVGSLVYYNKDTGVFEPAKMVIDADASNTGSSVEADSCHVEGIVISLDTSTGTSSTASGTILTNGYWKSLAAVVNCLGDDPEVGIYYLSPYAEGKAVKETGGYAKHPVMSYYGDGAFGMGLFYNASDNHYHGSCKLNRAFWVRVFGGDEFYYDAEKDNNFLRLGDVSEHTAALFRDGILVDTQAQTSSYRFENGTVYYKGAEAPSEVLVVFNHQMFAYNAPYIRSVRSLSSALSVDVSNGVVSITANDYVSGNPSYSAYAISAITGRELSYTPVISGIKAGDGITVDLSSSGVATISVKNDAAIDGLEYIDAVNVNHNGTLITSDAEYIYYTFPGGRQSSMIISAAIPHKTQNQNIYAFVLGGGNEAGTLSVSCNFIPFSTSKQPTVVSKDEQEIASLSVPGSNTVSRSGLMLTSDTAGFVTATLRADNPASDLRVLRVGFAISAVTPDDTAPEVPDSSPSYTKAAGTALVDSAVCGEAISSYTAVRFNEFGYMITCKASNPADADSCVGIAVSGATRGAKLDYLMSGVIQNTGFDFIPGELVYLGTDGHLVQNTQSANGKYLLESAAFAYYQILGVALTSSSVLVNIHPAVITGETDGQ